MVLFSLISSLLFGDVLPSLESSFLLSSLALISRVNSAAVPCFAGEDFSVEPEASKSLAKKAEHEILTECGEPAQTEVLRDVPADELLLQQRVEVSQAHLVHHVGLVQHVESLQRLLPLLPQVREQFRPALVLILR